MTEEQLKYCEDEFLALAKIKRDGSIIHAHRPKIIRTLATLIALVSEDRLSPVRCFVKTIDEGDIPVHQFTVEFANFGDR